MALLALQYVATAWRRLTVPNFGPVQALFVLLLTTLAGTTQAQPQDQVIGEDLVVTGNACIGVDCVGGETFGPNTGILKENNLIIRFFNTDSPDVPGRNWVVGANDSINAGPSYFGIETRSLDPEAVSRVSDGRMPAYDCVDGETFDPSDPNDVPQLTNDFIPFGDPVIVPGSEFVSTNPFLQDCRQVPWYAIDRVLDIGDGAHNSVTLGSGSVPTAGQVSVGMSEARRRLRHTAAPVNATDVLTVGTLQGTPTAIDMPAKRALVTALESQIAALQSQVTALESVAYAAATPTIARVEAGDGELFVYVTPGVDYLPILSFEATCSNGNQNVVGTSSTGLVTVAGLVNDTTYTCTATVTNSVQTSQASVPSAPVAPQVATGGLPVWLLIPPDDSDS